MVPESFAALALLLLGLAPRLIVAPRASARGRAWILAACGIGMAVVGLGMRQLARRQAMAAAPLAGIPAEVRQDGYVSSQACRACHPQQYDT